MFAHIPVYPCALILPKRSQSLQCLVNKKGIIIAQDNENQYLFCCEKRTQDILLCSLQPISIVSSELV